MLGFYIVFLLIGYLVYRAIKRTHEYNKWLANASEEERNKAIQNHLILLGTIFILNNIKK